MRTTHIVLALATALVHCASLEAIPSGTCGNGVIDPNEDCDTVGESCAQAGQANQCRFTCETAACKPGWGCGVEKICRQMTGELESAMAPVSTNAFTLLTGDFDGDGRADVVGSPRFGSAGASRVHYFDGNAGLGATTVLDLPISVGVVRDLDDDKRSDIGFSVRGLGLGAFGALGGQSDRTFSTIVFPSVSFEGASVFTIVTASANVRLPDGIGSCAVGLEADGNLHSLCGTSVGTKTAYNARTSLLPTAVYKEPRFGVLHADDKDVARVCGEVVFASNVGRPRVVIASPCNLGLDDTKKTLVAQWASQNDAKVSDVFTPDGMPIDDQVYVGPIVPNGRDGMLIHTSGGYYVYNDMTGLFEAPPASLVPVLTGRTVVPLASADLDGDGAIDFVFPGGIALTTSSPFADPDAGPLASTPGVRVVQPRDQLRWANAMIGRFNNDELPDVLVSFPDSLDVDVLGNGGGGRFTSFTVRSEKIVRAIATGDFDGDRIQDVAFIESDAALESGGSSDVVLAFGTGTGAPEAPHVVGRFKNARGFGPLRAATSAVDDLAVVQNPVDASGAISTAISVLYGSGARQQVAPLFMTDNNSLQPYQPDGTVMKGPSSGNGGGGRLKPGETARLWQPISFNVGSFGTAGAREILSIATGFVFRPGSGPVTDSFSTGAWVAASDGTAVGGIAPFIEQEILDPFVGLDPSKFALGINSVGTVTATADIDVPLNGIDEIVSLTSNPGGGGGSVYVVHINGAATIPLLAFPLPGASVRGDDPIDLVDLDGDGILDLVFVTAIGGKRSLSVARGTGGPTGGFSTTLVTLNSATDVVGFAKIQTGARRDGTAKTDLAVVTTSSLVLATLKQDGSDLDVHEFPKVLGSTTPQITAIVSGDVDGDGIPDLAIADGGSIRVIRQKPRLK